MTLGRVVFRAAPKGIDWALEVAFIRLDFPPAQRIIAQQLAAGLAEIVGMKIKQLKPEHNLSQIAECAATRHDDLRGRELGPAVLRDLRTDEARLSAVPHAGHDVDA